MEFSSQFFGTGKRTFSRTVKFEPATTKCIHNSGRSFQIKEPPDKSRLTAERAPCADIFRHFCQKLLEIRQYSRVAFDNLTKNSDTQYARSI